MTVGAELLHYKVAVDYAIYLVTNLTVNSVTVKHNYVVVVLLPKVKDIKPALQSYFCLISSIIAVALCFLNCV